MTDYRLKEAERRSDELGDYANWIDNNTDHILDSYIESLDYEDMPDSLQAEIHTDEVDEWDQVFQSWCDNLTIDDIPDGFIQDMYENHILGQYDDEDAYDRYRDDLLEQEAEDEEEED